MRLVKVTLISAILSIISVIQPAYGQNGVAIAASTATADPSAMLDIQSTVKGALVPRMSTTQRTSISSPATGLLVYDLTVPGFFYNSGIPSSPVWVQLSAGALSGSGTTGYDAAWTGTGSLGNSNVYNSGTSVGIGTTSPYTTLDVLGSIYTSVHGSTNEHATAEQGTSYIGHKSGNTSDGFAGMAITVDPGTNAIANAGIIQFYTWGNSVSVSREVARINESGYLGIGTTAPAYKLDVAGDINTNTGFTISGTATSGNYLRGNGTNFVSSAIQAGDIPTGSGNYIQNTTSQQSSSNYNISGTGTIGGNATVNGGTLSLGNGTSNLLSFNSNGANTPTFSASGTTPSVGEKIQLYPQQTTTSVDYGIGIAGSTLWQSIPQASSSFKFAYYGGTTSLMTLTGAGALSLSGTLNVSSTGTFGGSVTLPDNNNTANTLLYLAGTDLNHYIYSTGTGGNSMFLGEYGGVYNFYNTATGTTQISFSGGSMTATSLNGNPGGDGDGPLYSNSSGTIIKQSSCPSGYTWESAGITVICIRLISTGTDAGTAEKNCEQSYSGGHLCYYHEVEYACNQGFGIGSTYWLADRPSDDNYFYTNGSGCSNFDACCEGRTSASWGYYCCIDFVRF